MLKSLFINAGDLFLVTARCDLAGQFFRQQGAELATDSLLPRYTK